MKTSKTKKAVVKFLMAATALTIATSAFAATPKITNTINKDIITVGDVFEGAGDYAGRYLAPAPAVGQAMTLGANDLKRISDAFKLGWQPVTKNEQVVISRETRMITRDEVSAMLEGRMADKFPGQKLDISLNEGFKGLPWTGDEKPEWTVSNLDVDMTKTQFKANVSLLNADNAPTATQPISGRVHAMVDVPVLKSALRNGDLIDAHDIDYVTMRASDVSANTIVSAEKLIGQTPRRGVNQMKPLSMADIESPVVVKKGETVTVILKNGTLNLTMQGKALQNGAQGEVVRVINTASNKAIDGQVTGPQTVTISLNNDDVL